MSINLKSLQNINLTCGTNNDNYIKFNQTFKKMPKKLTEE